MGRPSHPSEPTEVSPAVMSLLKATFAYLDELEKDTPDLNAVRRLRASLIGSRRDLAPSDRVLVKRWPR